MKRRQIACTVCGASTHATGRHKAELRRIVDARLADARRSVAAPVVSWMRHAHGMRSSLVVPSFDAIRAAVEEHALDELRRGVLVRS